MRLGSQAACTAALLATLIATPALAQGPEGSRILSNKQAVQELEIYARCVVSRRQRAARTLALAPYASPEQSQGLRVVARGDDDDCIQGGFDHVRITVRPDVLAGAVARELLNRDYPQLGAVIDRSKVEIEAERARAAQLSVAERFGRCVVWNDPAGVQALLRADPGSTAEREAIAGLQQDMGMCLEEGATLRLDRSFVRNVTAVAAYRLAHQLQSLNSIAERG